MIPLASQPSLTMNFSAQIEPAPRQQAETTKEDAQRSDLGTHTHLYMHHIYIHTSLSTHTYIHIHTTLNIYIYIYAHYTIDTTHIHT